MLVRFAGPRLAGSDDDLVPVKLRRGGRTLGGSLSWDQPQPLAAFSREGPFGSMPVPKDVTVTRQVLAEPEAGLVDRTWATLADGTPLVTAAKRGKGMIVLFHVTADTRWSDLPLSGSFVDMLRRIVGTGRHDRRHRRTATRPHRARGGAADPHPRRLRRVRPADRRPRGRCRSGYVARATADHPPGFYGPPEGLLAVNTLAPADRLVGARLRAAQRAARGLSGRRAAGPARPGAAGGAGAARARRAGGVLPGRRAWRRSCAGARSARPRRCARGRDRGADVRLAGVRAGHRAAAAARRNAAGAPAIQRRPRRPSRPTSTSPCSATIETRLAYVVTGDAEVDSISKSGLQGLTLFLAQRTALEAGEPVGLDIARDELSFFPLIYWPVVPGAAQALARGARPHRRLHEERRHRAVRHPRRHHGAARPRRRNRAPGHGGAAHHPVVARHSRARAGAARPRADQDVLPAAGLPRPLQLRPALGRGAADRRRRRPTKASARRAPATASPRSSSPRTISPAPGRRAATARRCCRWCRASRASASSPSAPASTS